MVGVSLFTLGAPLVSSAPLLWHRGLSISIKVMLVLMLCQCYAMLHALQPRASSVGLFQGCVE